jgi:hypothetical protein
VGVCGLKPPLTIVLRAGGLKRAIDATGTRNNGRVAEVRKYDKARTKHGEKSQQNKQECPHLAHAF